MDLFDSAVFDPVIFDTGDEGTEGWAPVADAAGLWTPVPLAAGTWE